MKLSNVKCNIQQDKITFFQNSIINKDMKLKILNKNENKKYKIQKNKYKRKIINASMVYKLKRII